MNSREAGRPWSAQIQVPSPAPGLTDLPQPGRRSCCSHLHILSHFWPFPCCSLSLEWPGSSLLPQLRVGFSSQISWPPQLQRPWPVHGSQESVLVHVCVWVCKPYPHEDGKLWWGQGLVLTPHKPCSAPQMSVIEKPWASICGTEFLPE